MTARFRRREDSSIPRFGSRWTHIAPRWWMAEVHRPDSASCSQGRLHPELPEEWSTAYATSSRGAAACWALLLRIDSLSTRPGGGRHVGGPAAARGQRGGYAEIILPLIGSDPGRDNDHQYGVGANDKPVPRWAQGRKVVVERRGPTGVIAKHRSVVIIKLK
jgi:hypothetical protein